MGEDSLDWVDFVSLADLADGGSDLFVVVSWLEESYSGLHAIIGGSDGIGLDAGYLLLSDNNGVGEDSEESIEVGSKVNFDNISGAEFDIVTLKRGEMSTNFVDREAGGEGDSSSELLLLEGLLALRYNEVVTKFADLAD